MTRRVIVSDPASSGPSEDVLRQIREGATKLAQAVIAERNVVRSDKARAVANHHLDGLWGPISHRKTKDEWESLTPELQAMAPHVAEVLVANLGRATSWAKALTDEDRKVAVKTMVHLLAEAQRRARGS